LVSWQIQFENEKMSFNRGGTMETTFESHSGVLIEERRVKNKFFSLIVPIGRFLFSLIFIISGFNHFTSGSVGYADSLGVPMADFLVPISGLMAIIGGLSVLLGLHAKAGGVLLLLFLIPVTFMMHNFWTYQDPIESQMQMIHFLKNTALIGGIVFIIFFGAGPYSIDNKRND
jgi:putative oxidoreductase